MKNHKDEFEEFLTGEFKKSAEKEEESVQQSAEKEAGDYTWRWQQHWCLSWQSE